MSFHSQMASDLSKGDFGRPATNEPTKDVEGVCVEIGAQECLRLEFGGNVADQDVTDGDHATGMMPDGGSGDDFEQTLPPAISPGYLEASPASLGIGQPRGQRWLAGSDDAGSADGAGATSCRWVE